MTWLEKYEALSIDGRWIGLEKGDSEGGYFCTPVGARVIGWENGIHYCFIDGYGERVFAVNPETCCDKYVYPLAENFKDFLQLILACKATTAAEQIILWTQEQFNDFLVGEDNAVRPEQQAVLETIQRELGLEPMEEPYRYVRQLQASFDDSNLRFTSEYYDVLGLENPDETLAAESLFEFPPVIIEVQRKYRGGEIDGKA